jgi:OmpA-OmpF porin, OOP family
MTNGKKIVALIGLLAAAAAGPAAAQDRGVYVGAQAGVAQYQESCQAQPGVCDDKDGGARVFLGYQFNKYFALEGAYADAGSVKLSGNDPVFGPIDSEAQTYGFDLLGVFTIPLTERLSLLGKAGAFRFRATVDDRVTGASRGETSAGFAYGAGVGYDIGKLGIRAEFLRYDNVGGARAGEDNVMLYTLGLLFRFY